MKTIAESERLRLRELGPGDNRFIYELVNTKGWLKHIGNKHINNLEDAKNYMVTGPLTSYVRHGYGLYLVEVKDSETPVGLCGFTKRESVDEPDLGYAFLPEAERQGYAFESCTTVLRYAREVLLLKKVLAITAFDNTRSIKLLEKLGLVFTGPYSVPSSAEELLLFTLDLQTW